MAVYYNPFQVVMGLTSMAKNAILDFKSLWGSSIKWIKYDFSSKIFGIYTIRKLLSTVIVNFVVSLGEWLLW